MKDLTITYRYNLLPLIQISYDGLWINTLYCQIMSKEFLQGALEQAGFDHVSNTILEEIVNFSYTPQEPDDLTVTFRIPPKTPENASECL